MKFGHNFLIEFFGSFYVEKCPLVMIVLLGAMRESWDQGKRRSTNV